jgi:hypothetical protein
LLSEVLLLKVTSIRIGLLPLKLIAPPPPEPPIPVVVLLRKITLERTKLLPV